MKQRNIVTCIILSLVTCGIYGLYWSYNLIKDWSEICGLPVIADNHVVNFLLCCTPYSWYWMWLAGQGMDKRGGGFGSNNAILFIVMGVLCLGIVPYVMIQSEINKVATN